MKELSEIKWGRTEKRREEANILKLRGGRGARCKLGKRMGALRGRWNPLTTYKLCLNDLEYSLVTPCLLSIISLNNALSIYDIDK